VLPRVRDIAGDRMQVMMTGGIRRGTDILKTMALGADAVIPPKPERRHLSTHKILSP